MMKRLLSLLLSLMLVLTMLPMQAFALDEVEASEIGVGAVPVPIPVISVPHGYGYQQLVAMENGEDLAGAYDAIYIGVKKGEDSIDLSGFSLTADEAKLVYYTCRNAAPELFWMRGGFSYSISGDTVVSLSNFANAATEEERKAFEAGIEELMKGVLADDRSVALEMHDRLIDHVEYIETTHAHDAYGAIVEGEAVCEGYARAYQLLMHRMGLECLIVTGSSKRPTTGIPEGHAWNMVKLDENWVQVDTTWDDQGEQAFHAYFACTDEQMAVDHNTEDMGYLLPVCSDSSYRCFTAEQGNRFDTLAVADIAALLKQNIGDKEARCEFEFTGAQSAFGTWLNNNLDAIGKELGITSGTIGAEYGMLGNEYHLTVTGNIPHNHVYDRQNTDAQYLKSAATCTEPAVYYMSCSCGEKSMVTFCYGDLGPHNLSESVTIAEDHHERECTVCHCWFEEKHTFDNGVCTVCGYKLHEHQVKSYRAYEDCHSGECSICHLWINEDHNMDGDTCTICGYQQHEHNVEFNPNNDYWHGGICKECGSWIEQEHTFDKDGICTVCGYKLHEHQVSYYWAHEDCHSGECSVCHLWINEDHNMNGDTCTVCGYMNHKHTFGYDFYEDMHYGYCTECGLNQDGEEHTFDEDGICTVCGYQQHEHNVEFELIDESRHGGYCNICGLWGIGEHTFDNDGACTVCDYQLHPHEFKSYKPYTDCHGGICTVCGLWIPEEHHMVNGACTECGAIACEHDYEYDSDEWFHFQRCKVCEGRESTGTVHTIYKGICIVCGYKYRELKSITATATGMYSVGDAITDGDHITVTATLTDNSKVDVTADCVFGDFDSSTSGSKKVTVTYKDIEGIVKTTTVSVTVKAVSKLTVKAMPAKTGYVCGDELDAEGLVLEATFSDKSTEILSAEDYELTGFESAKTGAKTVKAAYSYGGKAVSVTFKVSVVKPVESITLDKTEASLAMGKSITLKATVAPTDATNKKVEWVSDDPTVASVSTSGSVKALKPGTATICCRSLDGFKAEAVCTVTVTPVATEVVICANGDEMTGGTIPINLSGEPEAIVFTAKVLPCDDGNPTDPTKNVSQEVNWTTSDKTVYVDEEGNLVMGELPSKAKMVTLTATTTDGSNKKATVKISFAYLVDNITITGSNSVAAGKSIKLTATLSTGLFDAKGKAIAPTNSKVVWESSDESVATVSGGTVKSNAKLTTQETVTITVKTTDGSDLEEAWDVTVYPATASVAIFHDGEDVTKGAVTLDLSEMEAGSIITSLTAVTYPEDASDSVTWKSSDKTVLIDEEGNISLTELPAKAKSVTITATAADGTNKNATVKLNLNYLIKSIELTGSDSVAAGKSIKLTATLSTGLFDAKGKAIAPTNSKVVWESSDESVATVSGGTVKANAKLTTQETVTITVKTTDGSNLEKTWDVTVYPATASVAIFYDGDDVTKGTVTLDLSEMETGVTIASLTAVTYPEDASNSVTWKSSDKTVLIDEEGNISLTELPAKAKSVTITATAADGTNKNATVKLNLNYLTKSIELSGSNSVAAGKSIKLTATLSTGLFDAKGKAIAPTNSKVVWESSDESVATVSGGTVKANAKLTTQKTVTITVKTTDGSEREKAWVVTVYPATTSVIISCDGEAKANGVTVDKSLSGLSVGGTITTLTAETNPAGTCGKVTWKSGNVKVAAIDENGVITLASLPTKATTVTFTVTAADGTAKTATIKLKLVL